MDFEVWEQYYLQILSEFGFSKEDDERSATILSSLLEGKNLVSEKELVALVQGKDVVVIGGARGLEAELSEYVAKKVIIAADGTTTTLQKKGLVPDIIVTDLDGIIEDQVLANNQGAIVAIHAHGDNIQKIRSWTPKFEGEIMGSVQCRPFGALHNFGGFTDGDRGVFLAHHFGAGSIGLKGFDFENVGEKPKSDKKIKLEKLKWAKRLISILGIEVDK
jgi:uncharacterized Rossmann fold enzyme